MGVRCEICGKELRLINYMHLRTHGISIDEYKRRYPHAKLSSEEHRANTARAIKKLYETDPEYNKRRLQALRKVTSRPEFREKMSKIGREKFIKYPHLRDIARESGKKSMKKLKANKEIEKKRIETLKSEEYRQKRSQQMKELYRKHPEILRKISETVKRTTNRPEWRQKQSERIKKWFEEHPEAAKRHGEVIKELISGDPEYRRKILENAYKGFLTVIKRGREKMPNQLESKLAEILEDIYPGEFKYNDGWFVLGGKIPDFVNVNGKKKLIELFGRYWHKPEEEQERVKLFRKYGWDCLVVWEDELKNVKKLKQKIITFS